MLCIRVPPEPHGCKQPIPNIRHFFSIFLKQVNELPGIEVGDGDGGNWLGWLAASQHMHNEKAVGH